MARFNEQNQGTKTVNLAGGEAYKASPKLELISALLTSFMDDKYYESANDRVARLRPIIEADPEFAAKTAVFARNEFGMRSITHVVASELAKFVSGKPWADNFYKAIVRRPDDMTEILAYHFSRGEKMSNAMKKGLGSAFDKFDGYQIAKYKSDNKNVSLIDVMRLTHPSPTEKNALALKALKDGELKNTETWEAKLSGAGKQEGDKEANKAKAWADVLDKMGYMALLRNLRNIEQQAPYLVQKAADRLIDPEAIRKSLVLPFRFYSAIENVESREFKHAISRAADISVANVPKLSGRTLVAVDTSGSMNGRPEKIARMFGSILYKACNSDLLVFDNNAQYVPLNPADSVFGVMDRIPFRGGGTNFHSIFDTAQHAYDRIIILSDMQGWMDRTNYGWGYGSSNSNPKGALADYRKRTNSDPIIYSFDLQGYGQLEFAEQNVVALSGWSDKIFNLLEVLEKGVKALEEKIMSIEFAY